MDSTFKRLKDFLDLTLIVAKGFEEWEIPDTKWGTQKKDFKVHLKIFLLWILHMTLAFVIF